MSDAQSTQSTLVTDATDSENDSAVMDSDDTIDDDGLLDKVRSSSHPAVRCGYCHDVALKGYKTSAHGREYCPECQTVRAADQRDEPLSPWWKQ